MIHIVLRNRNWTGANFVASYSHSLKCPRWASSASSALRDPECTSPPFTKHRVPPLSHLTLTRPHNDVSGVGNSIYLCSTPRRAMTHKTALSNGPSIKISVSTTTFNTADLATSILKTVYRLLSDWGNKLCQNRNVHSQSKRRRWESVTTLLLIYIFFFFADNRRILRL